MYHSLFQRHHLTPTAIRAMAPGERAFLFASEFHASPFLESLRNRAGARAPGEEDGRFEELIGIDGEDWGADG